MREESVIIGGGYIPYRQFQPVSNPCQLDHFRGATEMMGHFVGLHEKVRKWGGEEVRNPLGGGSPRVVIGGE